MHQCHTSPRNTKSGKETSHCEFGLPRVPVSGNDLRSWEALLPPINTLDMDHSTSLTSKLKAKQHTGAGNLLNGSGSNGSEKMNMGNLSRLGEMEGDLEDQLPFFMFALDRLEEGVVLVVDQRIQFANRAAMELLGEHFSERKNFNFVEAVVPPDAPHYITQRKEIESAIEKLWMKESGTTSDVHINRSVDVQSGCGVGLQLRFCCYDAARKKFCCFVKRRGSLDELEELKYYRVSGMNRQ